MSIKELRLEKGWSQEQLAELSNLSTRTIQRIEKDNKASIESLKSLAEAFKLELSELKENLESIEKTKIEDNKSIEKKGFFNFLVKDSKFIKFLIINLVLLLINITSGMEHLWFIYPLLGWGIPLVYKKYNQYNNVN